MSFAVLAIQFLTQPAEGCHTFAVKLQEVGVDHRVPPLVQSGGGWLVSLAETHFAARATWNRWKFQLGCEELMPLEVISIPWDQNNRNVSCFFFCHFKSPRSFNQIMLGMVGGAPGPRFPPIPGDEWLERALNGRTPVGLFGGCEAQNMG